MQVSQASVSVLAADAGVCMKLPTVLLSGDLGGAGCVLGAADLSSRSLQVSGPPPRGRSSPRCPPDVRGRGRLAAAGHPPCGRRGLARRLGDAVCPAVAAPADGAVTTPQEQRDPQGPMKDQGRMRLL